MPSALDFSSLKYLFLDRDGVLNRRIPDDYVRNPDQWEWLPGALEALSLFAGYFEIIVIVSNQQGVGKGLFSETDLHTLTRFFLEDIRENGGRIDKVFYCTHLKKEDCACRKPGTGMATLAKEAFPQIDFSASLMTGDSLSDMQFGKNAGMKTVFITTERQPEPEEQPWIDACYGSLKELAEAMSASGASHNP